MRKFYAKSIFRYSYTLCLSTFLKRAYNNYNKWQRIIFSMILAPIKQRHLKKKQNTISIFWTSSSTNLSPSHLRQRKKMYNISETLAYHPETWISTHSWWPAEENKQGNHLNSKQKNKHTISTCSDRGNWISTNLKSHSKTCPTYQMAESPTWMPICVSGARRSQKLSLKNCWRG